MGMFLLLSGEAIPPSLRIFYSIPFPNQLFWKVGLSAYHDHIFLFEKFSFSKNVCMSAHPTSDADDVDVVSSDYLSYATHE